MASLPESVLYVVKTMDGVLVKGKIRSSQNCRVFGGCLYLPRLENCDVPSTKLYAVTNIIPHFTVITFGLQVSRMR